MIYELNYKKDNQLKIKLFQVGSILELFKKIERLKSIHCVYNDQITELRKVI